jgi:hypothetical protein
MEHMEHGPDVKNPGGSLSSFFVRKIAKIGQAMVRHGLALYSSRCI